jgi:2-methylisocitrate lyase-like PEP mutase family enzyme
MSSFRQLLAGDRPIIAPFVFSPLSAKLAEAAGFRALYLGGGGLGYLKCITEANLTLPEMAAVGVDIKSVCSLPLILDGAGGWGDPMHLHRTIHLAEAAGFCGIEIEDQLLPKRAHHHIGREHLIPTELMVAKVAEAVAARTNPDFVIIARTNASRTDLDEALRRCEAYHKAGADMLFALTMNPENIRKLGERLPAPLMHMIPPGSGVGKIGLSLDEMFGLGFRLVVDGLTPLVSMHRTLRATYQSLARGEADPYLGSEGLAELDKLHETIDLEKLLDVERRTVERG